MAHPFQITIAESIHEHRSHQRKNGELIGIRLLMLIVIKKHKKNLYFQKRTLKNYWYQS